MILVNKILGAYLAPHPPIIIKEIGRGEEKKAKKTIEAMELLSQDIESKSPSTIVLITPHGPLFSDAIAIAGEEKLKGSFKRFGFKNLNYTFQNNLALVEKILEKSSKKNISMIKIDGNIADIYNIENELDHGALVPLHFIDEAYRDYKLVHITYGMLASKDLYRFGQLTKESIIESDEKAVIIASGDLSHKLSSEGPYEYSPYGKEFDEKIIDIIKKGQLKDLISFDLNLAEKAGECGLRSLMIMAGTLDRYEIDSKVLSYEGPFGVGYGTAIIDIVGNTDKDLLKQVNDELKLKIEKIRKSESTYVSLARESLEYFMRTGKYLNIDKESDTKKGVFVTLKKDGMLRGCIGTTEPTTTSIEREIVQNAVSAGTRDPRFDRVEKEELEDIVYSVDVLSDAEVIDSMDDLDVEKYGVIVSKDNRRGLLLPNLEGIDTVKEQLEIALGKADIGKDEDYKIERFKVTRYS